MQIILSDRNNQMLFSCSMRPIKVTFIFQHYGLLVVWQKTGIHIYKFHLIEKFTQFHIYMQSLYEMYCT